MVLVKDDQLTLNEDKELKDWFRTWYFKWMETCDNLRWVSSGKGEKHPLAHIPFVPFGVVPGLPYTTLLITMIDVLVGQIPDELTDPLGNPGHMLTIIEDPGTNICPYILMEWVYGGVITKHKLFRNRPLEEVLSELRDPFQVDTETLYKKTVTTSFLRELRRLHQQWLVHGDNARYLIDFFDTMLKGLDDGTAEVEPPLPMLENLQKIVKQIHIEDLPREEILAFVRRFSSRLPNIVFRTRRGEIPIDLGGKFTVSISEASLFALLDGVKLNDNLADLASHMLAFVQKSLRKGWIQISGLEWLSRISVRLFKQRVYSLSNKTQVLAKIMANPFRMAIILECRALILTMKNGGLTKIDLIPLEKDSNGNRSSTLEEQWLCLCKEQDFIHLAVTLKETPQTKYFTLRPPGDLSILQRIEFYPKNDFVRFILRKGPLQLFFNVVMPFLSA